MAASVLPVFVLNFNFINLSITFALNAFVLHFSITIICLTERVVIYFNI